MSASSTIQETNPDETMTPVLTPITPTTTISQEGSNLQKCKLNLVNNKTENTINKADDVTINFWNINGVNNLFNLDVETINIILKGDIVCLCETWHYYDNIALPNLFQDYTSRFNSLATKDKSRGRASGGLLILIKNNCFQDINLIEATNLWIIMQFNHKNKHYIIFFTYLKPNLEIACIDLLNDSLTQITETYLNHQIIIIGDFNAHIGDLNMLNEDEILLSTAMLGTRTPLHKNTNTRGIKLVDNMENLGFISLNGRTQGDCPGKYTYISNSGKSTIDLAWVNLQCCQYITQFQIYHTLSNSPHGVCSIKLGNTDIHNNSYLSIPQFNCNYKITFKFKDINSNEYLLNFI